MFSLQKKANEKNTITIYKILHKVLNILKKFYEIVKVLKAIKGMFS